MSGAISFNFTANHLPVSDDVDRYFREKIKVSSIKQYNLVFTGPISVGKSVISQSMYELFSSIGHTIAHPEYINIMPHISGPMLKAYIDNDISNVTFQNFVLDLCEYNYKNSQYTGSAVHIYERLIDDSIMCFANIANKHGTLSDAEFGSLVHRMNTMIKTYDLPTYSNCNFVVLNNSDIDTVLKRIIDVIEMDIENGITSRVVGLTSPLEECERRIIARAREGEENYSHDFLSMVSDFYAKLYCAITEHLDLSDINVVRSLVAQTSTR